MNKLFCFLLAFFFLNLDISISGFYNVPFFLMTRLLFYLSILESIPVLEVITFTFLIAQLSIYNNFNALEFFWLIFIFLALKQLKNNFHQYFFTKYAVLLTCLIIHYFLIDAVMFSKKLEILACLKQILIFSILIIGLLKCFERGKKGNRLRVKI